VSLEHLAQGAVGELVLVAADVHLGEAERRRQRPGSASSACA
jgi:hypothetical protein